MSPFELLAGRDRLRVLTLTPLNQQQEKVSHEFPQLNDPEKNYICSFRSELNSGPLYPKQGTKNLTKRKSSGGRLATGRISLLITHEESSSVSEKREAINSPCPAPHGLLLVELR